MTDYTGPIRQRKTVVTGGLTFTIHSSRERSCTVGDRHFFAIGRNCAGWTLFEHAESIVEQSTRCLGRKFERLLDTEALVVEIKRLVESGEHLPTNISPPWEIDADRFKANQAALLYERYAKANAKLDEKQKAEDAKNDRWMKKNGLAICERCHAVGRAHEHCAQCGCQLSETAA
jgi:ribosomal protein L32